MVRKLSLCAAVLALAALAIAQAPASKGKSKTVAKGASADQAIMDKEKELWDAWKKQDGGPFKEALADNMVFVDETGVYGKDRFLDDLAKQPCQIKSVSLTEMKVTRMDSDSPLLTYRAEADGTCNGQPTPPAYHSTVYSKQGGKWVVMFHQSSNAQQK